MNRRRDLPGQLRGQRAITATPVVCRNSLFGFNQPGGARPSVALLELAARHDSGTGLRFPLGTGGVA